MNTHPRYLTLDDGLTLLSAREDPVGMIRSLDRAPRCGQRRSRCGDRNAAAGRGPVGSASVNAVGKARRPLGAAKHLTVLQILLKEPHRMGKRLIGLGLAPGATAVAGKRMVGFRIFVNGDQWVR